MKKIKFTLTIALLLCVNVVSAQWRLGAEAGMIANFTKSNNLSTDTKVGYKLGVMGSYEFKNNIILETAFSYGQKKAEFSGLNIRYFHIAGEEFGNDYITSSVATIKHIEIPVLIGYSFKINDKFSITPKVGGYFSYGLKPSYSLNKTTYVNNREFKYNLYPNKNDIYYPERMFERVDAGVQFALELNYRNFLLRASYNLGLTNIYSNFSSHAHNRNLNLTIGYYFWQNKK